MSNPDGILKGWMGDIIDILNEMVTDGRLTMIEADNLVNSLVQSKNNN